MFLKRTNQQYNQNPFQENMNNLNTTSLNSNYLYPNYEQDRLIYEIKENRRRINNLAKRIVRLENYLRIRDTTDYSIIEDDKNESFESFYK